MISRSQMRRQLYQNAGMVSPMQQGIGSMMPAGAQQGQAPKKDYAKIKQILRELYAKDPKKFQEAIMKLKDKIPPQVLQELIQTIQGENGARSMAASGGIMTVPRAKYGFGSSFGNFVSGITGGIGDVLSGAADGIGDVVSGIDLGDVATAVAFVVAGPQAAAMVNGATGGTGNKYLDMGLNLYAAGSGGPGEGFSLSNLGSGSFQAGSGQMPDIFGSGSGGDIFGGDIFGSGSGGDIFGSGNSQGLPSFSSYLPVYGKEGDENRNVEKTMESNTANIIKELVKGGTSIYGAYKAKEDQKRINDIVDRDSAAYRQALANKRNQYNAPSPYDVNVSATAEDVVRTPVMNGGRMNFGNGTSKDEGWSGIHRAKRIWNILPDDIQGKYGNDFQRFFMGKDWEGVKMAEGGRIGYAYGNSVQDGIMAAPQIADQMGMPVGNPRQNQQGVAELDYREEGGFVPPIGIKEKEDDIPAMLSNNEFVFTAKSVKNADPEGKQDPERGAERMYAMMKQLENGGRV